MDYKRVLRKTIKRVARLEYPVVVDIGAYKGALAEELHRLNDKAFVYLVEPNSLLLKKTFARMDYVHIAQYAISNKPEVQFYGGVKSHLSDSVYKTHMRANDGCVVISGITMDALMKRLTITHLDLLVMNCEGGEYSAFDTVGWLKVPDRILIQLHGNTPFGTDDFRHKRVEIYKKLENAGFVLAQGRKQVRHKGKINQLWEKA